MGAGNVRTRKIAAIAAAAACAMAALTAIAGAKPAHTGADRGDAVRGGTYRVDWESSFDFTSDFDPTGEYSVQAFGLYSNLLVRTLDGLHLATIEFRALGIPIRAL